MRFNSIVASLFALAPASLFVACGSTVDTVPKSSGGAGGGTTTTTSSSSSGVVSSSSSSSGTVVDAGSDANGMPSDVYPAPHPAAPKVAWSGGTVLKAPKIYPVFFSNDDPTTKGQIADFVSKIGATEYWKETTTEYGVGPATGEAPIELAEPSTGVFDDNAIQSWLAGKLNADDPAFPAADENSIYMLVYPADVSITQGGQASCVAFGGYHNSTTLDAAHGGLPVAYAVIPRCANFDYLTGIDAVTGAASHELVEGVTDPYPMMNPAYAQVDNAHIYWLFALGGGETADMCAQNLASFTQFPELAYTVQRSWSNKAAAASHDPCVPAIAGQAYFNSVPVMTDQLTLGGGGQTFKLKGVHIPVGSSKTIDLDLFSDGPTGGPWSVSVQDQSAYQGGQPSLDFSLDTSEGQNGQILHLTITALTANQYKAAIFYVVSQLGDQQSMWIGIVGN